MPRMTPSCNCVVRLFHQKCTWNMLALSLSRSLSQLPKMKWRGFYTFDLVYKQRISIASTELLCAWRSMAWHTVPWRYSLLLHERVPACGCGKCDLSRFWLKTQLNIYDIKFPFGKKTNEKKKKLWSTFRRHVNVEWVSMSKLAFRFTHWSFNFTCCFLCRQSILTLAAMAIQIEPSSNMQCIAFANRVVGFISKLERNYVLAFIWID